MNDNTWDCSMNNSMQLTAFEIRSSKQIQIMTFTVSRAGGEHLVQVLHCRVEVHSLGILLLEDKHLAPEEGSTRLPAQS